MLIVGDVGGTKTLLASIDTVADNNLEYIKTYKSYNYATFDAILEDYLNTHFKPAADIKAISLAVAGPVANNHSRLTNLTWSIGANQIQEKTNINKVHIYNDLEAIAAAICYDAGSLNLTVLKTVDKPRRPSSDYAAKAIIAPGTGLGMSYAIFYNGQYIVLPSQGGHINFAPQTKLQSELLEYIQLNINVRSARQVGLEQVCSGVGLPNIFNFFRYYKKINLATEFIGINTDQDPKELVPMIINNAINNTCELCYVTIQLFLEILAQAIQTLALTVYAIDGIYLAGGIALALKTYLQQTKFLSQIVNNTTMREVLDKFPIYLCENKNIALLGASKLVNLKCV
jgi:glucokinase